MELSGELHASAALHTGKEPHYPLERRLDGPPEWFWTRR